MEVEVADYGIAGRGILQAGLMHVVANSLDVLGALLSGNVLVEHGLVISNIILRYTVLEVSDTMAVFRLGDHNFINS